MEHRNRCTDLRHPEALATCCPCSSVHPVQVQKGWTTAAFAQFQFLDPTVWGCAGASPNGSTEGGFVPG